MMYVKPIATIYTAKRQPEKCAIVEGDKRREVGRRKAQQFLFEAAVAGLFIYSEQVKDGGIEGTIIWIYEHGEIEPLLNKERDDA